MTAVTIGKFDGFHLGHRLLLEELREISREQKDEIPTCVCKIDFSGPGLLSRAEQSKVLEQYQIYRMRRLAFSEYFASQTPEEFVRRVLVSELGATNVVVGSDFCFGYNRTGNVDTLRQLGEKYGFRVIAVEKLRKDGEVVSSTRIRSLISEGRVEEAGVLLGQPVSYQGRVCHGRELGRTIGFPTCNLQADPEKLLPLYGVYQTEVLTPLGTYAGITNIGQKPTVEENGTPTIETHIPGFNGNLYDEEITVRLKRFLRPEKRFASVEELKEQLRIDVDCT